MRTSLFVALLIVAVGAQDKSKTSGKEDQAWAAYKSLCVPGKELERQRLVEQIEEKFPDLARDVSWWEANWSCATSLSEEEVWAALGEALRQRPGFGVRPSAAVRGQAKRRLLRIVRARQHWFHPSPLKAAISMLDHNPRRGFSKAETQKLVEMCADELQSRSAALRRIRSGGVMAGDAKTLADLESSIAPYAYAAWHKQGIDVALRIIRSAAASLRGFDPHELGPIVQGLSKDELEVDLAAASVQLLLRAARDKNPTTASECKSLSEELHKELDAARRTKPY